MSRKEYPPSFSALYPYLQDVQDVYERGGPSFENSWPRSSSFLRGEALSLDPLPSIPTKSAILLPPTSEIPLDDPNYSNWFTKL